MGSLSNLYISQSYISLIHLGSNNTASTTPIELQDGLGNGIGVSVSTNGNLYVSGNIYATNLTGSGGGTVDTSSFVSTASFNAYTQSTNNTIAGLQTTSSFNTFSSSNYAVNVSQSQQIVASFATASAFSASAAVINNAQQSQINSLTSATASYAISSSVKVVTDSLQTQINGLSTTASVSTLSASIYQTDATQSSLINGKLDTSSFTTFSSSISTQFSASTFFSGTQYKGDSSSFDSRINNISAPIGYVTTASFNSYTQSVANTIATLATTASVTTLSASIYSTDATQSSLINGKLDTSSFTTFSTSVDSRLDLLELSGSGFATTASVNALSASIYQTDATQSNAITNNSSSFATSISASNFNITNNSASVAITINNLSSSIFQTDATQSNQISALSASNAFDHSRFATTGSNTFNGNQTVNGAISASGNISASSLYVTNATIVNLTTVYETSSVIYSSGSNQLGDELTDVQILSGSVQIVGSGSINGSRIITSADTASMAVSSSLYSVTSSYAVNAQTASEARNLVIIARNGNQSTLSAGTVVRITSAVGDNPIFNTASYDTEALSSNTLGILRSSTTSGADGEVVVNGIVLGVNTDPTLGYVAGDVLYLSASGQFTRVQPQAPLQTVTLGEVLRAQQNNGSIYVNVSNGWELNELHNVQINTPLTNDLLVYESSSYGLWKNKSISSLGLNTTSSFNAYTQSTNTFTASVSTSVGLLQTFSSSQYKADSSSFDSRILAAGGQPQVQDEGTILGNVTSFNFIGAGVTASVNAGTASINISAGGTIDTGSLVTTASFNAYTSSQDFKNTTFTTTASFNSLSTSVDSRLDSLEGAGYVTSTITASSLVTASFNNGTRDLTFTKGDSSTFSVNIPDVSGSTINTGSFITTGSASTGSQTILGDFKFNTTYTGSQPITDQGAGGSNVVEVSYSEFGDDTNMLFWANNNWSGIVVNGPGVTNATVVSTNFGANYEVTLSSGTVTGGGTYTFSGLAFQAIEATGSLYVTQEVRAVGPDGQKAVMDIRGVYSKNANGGLQSGVSTDGGVYSGENTNFDYVRLTISGSQNGGAEYAGAQLAMSANFQTRTQFGFQGTSDYTDGRITAFQPLFLSQSLIVSGGASFADLTGSLSAFSASISNRINNVSGSGGTINTGSFATTGSNNFVGPQQIKNGVIQVANYDEPAIQYVAPTVFQGVGTSSVAYEQFINGGNYDCIHIQSNASAGTDFQDLTSNTFTLQTWLNIPTNTGNNPAPQFKRGLGITGSTSVNGAVQISSSATYDLDITGAFQASAASRVSSSAGVGTIAATFLQTTSGSFANGASSIIGRGYTQASFNGNTITMFASGGTGIGGVGSAPLGSSGIAINSGSIPNTFYYPILFQSSPGYTDGRVTFTTPIQANSDITASGVFLSNSNLGTAFSVYSASAPADAFTRYGRDGFQIYQYQGQAKAFGVTCTADQLNNYTGSQFRWGTVDGTGAIENYMNMVSASYTGSISSGTPIAGIDVLQTGQLLNFTKPFTVSANRVSYIDAGLFVSQSVGGAKPALTIDGTNGSNKAIIATGSVDITGSLTVNGVQPLVPSYGSFTSATVSSGVLSSLSQEFASGFEIVSSSYMRATKQGVYQVTANVAFDAGGSSGNVSIGINKNGSNISGTTMYGYPAANAANVGLSSTTLVNLNANDYVEIAVDPADDAVLSGRVSIIKVG